MNYEWESNLETGHSQIDNQHKQLFVTLNSIITESKKPKLSEGFIFSTVRFLLNYTVEHFETEEHLMRKYHYEEFAAHKKLHEDFKKAAVGLYNTLIKKGASDELMKELITTVGNWLLIHIKGEDQKMASFVKTKDFENTWNPDLEIGDKQLDDQNKQLFLELNTFIVELLKPRISKDVITRTVDFLMGYIIVHFYSEEQLMEKYGYNKIFDHKRLHRDLIDAVRSINLLLINKGAADLQVQEKITYIFNLLLDHIKGEDQKLASFVKGRYGNLGVEMPYLEKLPKAA